MLSNPTMTLAELIEKLERTPIKRDMGDSSYDELISLIDTVARVLRAVEGLSVGNACPEHLAPGYPTVCSGCAVDARIDAAIAAGLRGSDERQ